MTEIPAESGFRIYQPPKQSSRGQLVDSLIILVLLMVVLFGVTYFVQSSTSATSVKTRPLSELPITETEKQQYALAIKEGIVDLPTANQQVADNHEDSNKYPIAVGTLIITFGVIALYMAFVYLMSFKEYREVIRERFGPPGSTGSSPEVGS
jgi:ABC-type glycerol-3-phosphate transport system permease component